MENVSLLTITGKKIAPEKWGNRPKWYCQGILVEGDDAPPFLLAPEAQQLPFVTDTRSPKHVDETKFAMFGEKSLLLDGRHISNTLSELYQEFGYSAPALQYCRKYAHGRFRQGQWGLPTPMQLSTMFRFHQEVRLCADVLGMEKERSWNTMHRYLYFWSCSVETPLRIWTHVFYPNAIGSFVDDGYNNCWAWPVLSAKRK